ncbi:hypothetical protein [Ruegeria profundi]|uniref:hypothetical protein n=1 Tax=Ruegeria profundi TaxID=1685378 RepID=UPI003C7B07FE
MVDLLVKAFPFAVGALIGALASFVVSTRVVPNLRNKEKATMVLAELANAIRHFERSIQNLESFQSEKRLGRRADYEKCKYSSSGFVGLSFADLMGLPDKLSRDVMQMGLVYRNQNLEVDYVIGILDRSSENDQERTAKFEAMAGLIERMRMIIDMSEALRRNVVFFSENTTALSANKEIPWSDDFYESGKRYDFD